MLVVQVSLGQKRWQPASENRCREAAERSSDRGVAGSGVQV
jgi:hypothetical protein